MYYAAVELTNLRQSQVVFINCALSIATSHTVKTKVVCYAKVLMHKTQGLEIPKVDHILSTKSWIPHTHRQDGPLMLQKLDICGRQYFIASLGAKVNFSREISLQNMLKEFLFFDWENSPEEKFQFCGNPRMIHKNREGALIRFPSEKNLSILLEIV